MPNTRIRIWLLWWKMPVFFIIFMLASGCLNKTTQYLLWKNIARDKPTHQEVLAGSLKQIAATGKLGERALFIAFFPLYLAEMGNLIEQGEERSSRVEPKKKDFLGDKNDTVISEMLHDNVPIRRAVGLEILSGNDLSKQSQKALLAALADDDAYVKLVALHNAQNLAGLKYNTRLLFDNSEIVRIEAIRNIKKKDKTILDSLYICLKDHSALVRAETAKTLARLDDRVSVDYLWDLLQDREEYVRKQAAIALARLTGKDFNYPYYRERDQREKVAQTWRRWWQAKTPKEKTE